MERQIKKYQVEQMIEATFAKVIDIKKMITSIYDPVIVAQAVSHAIENEHDWRNDVIINVSGGRKTQACGSSSRIWGTLPSTLGNKISSSYSYWFGVQ